MLSHDWDIYECHDTSRTFYHNPTSGEVSWKPPRGIKSPADNVKKPILVRNGDNKEVFTFDRRQSKEEKKENEDENAERTSIVRDSIRYNIHSIYD